MRKHMVLFIILNIMDYVTTRIALGLGGYEANPIARVFMGYNLLWLYKLVMVVAIIFLIHLLYKKHGEKRALFYYKLGNVILLLVIVWNIYLGSKLWSIMADLRLVAVIPQTISTCFCMMNANM